MATEIMFLVVEAPQDGYTARSATQALFVEANDLTALHTQVRDAVRCHFETDLAPKLIRLHFVRDEVIAT